MTSYLLILLPALVTAAVLPEFTPDTRYHEIEGIPSFARTKQFEEGIDFDGGRIWGGQAIEFTAHPYIGGVIIALRDGRTSMCGSSLLTNTRSITAAHCWRTPTLTAVRFTMVWGSNRLLTGGFRINTNDVVVHPNYNMNTLHSDVAVIRHLHIAFNYGVGRVNIPSSSLFDQYAGTWAVAVGFGRTSDDDPGEANPVLREANMLVITNEECARTFGRAVVASTLCASTAHGSSPCAGDSGGPLVRNPGHWASALVIGIKSFGTQWCTRGYPTAYARVTRFESWIRLTM